MIATLKPYHEMKDSGNDLLGKIPMHWKLSRVSNVATIVNGYPFDSQHFVKGKGIPLIRIRDLFRTETEVNYGGPPVAEALVQTGEIIIGMDGDFNVARWRGSQAFLNQRLCCLRTNSSSIPGFVARAVERPLREIAARTPSTTVKHLSSSQVRGIYIGNPPREEQSDIVRFLDYIELRIQEYIRSKQKLIALLLEGRVALITHTVTRGLEPDVDKRVTRSHVFPLVPKNWKLRKIRHLIQRVRRPIVVEADKEYREIGIRSWGKGIFHKEAVRGVILGDKSVFRIEPGDFVLNIVFAWEGAVSVVSENENGMIASHRFPTFRPSSDVDLDYLLMVFQSEQGRRLMEVNSPGAAGRNKTLRINQLLDEEIPLPALGEQQRIVAAFRDEEQRLTECATKIRQATDQLKEFRSRLIADVVTGKLDVRAAAAELPEADPATTVGDASDEVDSQAGAYARQSYG